MIEEGEGVTRDSFGSRISNLLPAERTKFWYELRHTVSLGMAYDSDLEDRTLVAPYVWLLSDVEQLAITGTRVAVRERPAVSAPVIARLTYDVVKYGPEVGKAASPATGGGSYEWVHIGMPDGRTGWVLSKYVRSAGEPPLCLPQSEWPLKTRRLLDR